MKVLLNVFLSYIVFSGLLVSCAEPISPIDSPEDILVNSMEALYMHDVEGYVENVDFGNSDDSIQRNLFVNILQQHQERTVFLKGKVDSCVAVDVKYSEDSVAIVYYKLFFSDGTSEVSSQKMVRVNEKWKIRIRN